jgi:hypothetical protein
VADSIGARRAVDAPARRSYIHAFARSRLEAIDTTCLVFARTSMCGKR